MDEKSFGLFGKKVKQKHFVFVGPVKHACFTRAGEKG
jgi:hypothetical protein